MVFWVFSWLTYLLVFSTLTAWLTGRLLGSAIGLFAWVGMTYSVKVIWAPIVDRAVIPFLGRILGQRRSWILFGQMLVVFGLIAISIFGVSNLPLLALFSGLLLLVRLPGYSDRRVSYRGDRGRISRRDVGILYSWI